MRAVQFRCQQYVFAFAGDPRLVGELESLFVDLVTVPVAEPHLWRIEKFHAHVRLIVDESDVGEWVRRDVFPAAAISKLTMTVIGAQPGQLHLHAGAVVADGATVLLLAPSGSGKSTLTCALVAGGALYRTDEVVAVDLDGRRITTYPKPLSVKETGIGAVERLTGVACPPEVANWELPASSFGALASGDDDPVRTIVLNTYVPDQPVLAEPLHRATAARNILADSQDAVLLGPDSLVAVAHLVGSARCLRVTGDDAAEMGRAIREAHRQPVEHGEVAIVPAASSGGGPSRAPDACSVLIDGRAVLYTSEPSHVVELDEAQTVWWLLLDGTPFDRIVDDVVEETGAPRAEVVTAGTTFVDGFRSLGVLSDQ